MLCTLFEAIIGRMRNILVLLLDQNKKYLKYIEHRSKSNIIFKILKRLKKHKQTKKTFSTLIKINNQKLLFSSMQVVIPIFMNQLIYS